MGWPYAVRRAADICPDVLPENITRRLNYSSFVNLERGYLYFEVPKSACTSMKWLLHRVEGLPPIRHYVGPNREARRDMFIHARDNLAIPSLLQLDDEAQEYALTSPEVMRFTVVRNPYTRVESAWKDKVRLCAPRYEDLCLDIKGALPSGDDPASQVSFAEFIDAIEGQDLARCDAHWRSQWEHTLRGALNFTRVGRVEALSDVVGAFLAHVGADGGTPAPVINTAARETEYDEALARRVHALYASDFREFRYGEDSWPRPSAAAASPALVAESRFVDEVLERNIVIGQLYEERDALRRRIETLEKARDRLEPVPTRPAAGTLGRRVIITPYYQESREVLERCMRSVRDQTVATDHILVADGFAQDWIDQAGVRHVRLDRSHADYGDTPRGVGAMLAAQEGYEAVGFLDADCWLEPDHVEYCLGLAAQAGEGGCDYVIALRHERRPDGTIMEIGQVSPDKHVDTNCFFFLRPSFHIFPVWCAIPQPVSVVGDRVFYSAVKANGLKPAIAARKTVNYTCLWESIYRAMGETPPNGAKPNPDHGAVEAWIEARAPAELAAINRAIHTPLEHLYPLYKAETEQPAALAEPEPVVRPAESVKNPAAPAGQTICLCMIVKDEAPVIARCLASVRPLIDHWVIVDTGSSDGTQQAVREAMAGVPGDLYERPWVDFAHNRSEALALARPHGAYTLIIDADDVFETPRGFRMPILTAESYEVEIRNKNRRYWRPQLVQNTLPWRYEGVLHEFLSAADDQGRRILPQDRTHRRLSGVRIVMSEEGARRRTSGAERFGRDAAILEAALAKEADPFMVARYQFYLAQSWLDAGESEKALAAYETRAELGFWDQEVFISLNRAGNLKAALGREAGDVLASYRRANAIDGRRAEPLHVASRYCREHERFEEGYGYAKRAIGLAPPPDGLFIEQWIYDYGALDEYAVNAYWSEHYDESLRACRRMLTGGLLPASDRPRVEANRDFAAAKLRELRPVVPPKRSKSGRR